MKQNEKVGGILEKGEELFDKAKHAVSDLVGKGKDKAEDLTDAIEEIEAKSEVPAKEDKSTDEPVV